MYNSDERYHEELILIGNIFGRTNFLWAACLFVFTLNPWLNPAGSESSIGLRVNPGYPGQSLPAPGPALDAFQDELYHTYAEMTAVLLDRSNQYDGDPGPDILRLHSLGQTHAGREILAVKISDNPGINEAGEKEILYVGAHHAIELVGVEITLALIDELLANYETGDPAIRELIAGSEIWIVPQLNPDGQAQVELGLNWRKNTNLYPDQSETNKGVDLNRNYAFRWNNCGTTLEEKLHLCQSSTNPTSGSYIGPSAFSEEETQAIRDFTGDPALVDGFTGSLSWHSYGGEILYPWHYTENAPYRTEQDRFRFDAAAHTLSAAIAQARGDRGEPPEGYDISHPFRYLTGGSSDDWLYAERGILALSIEAYGEEEGNAAPPNGAFNPATQGVLDRVIANNLAAALAFAAGDFVFRSYLPVVARTSE